MIAKLDLDAGIASRSLERYAAISVAPPVRGHTEILDFEFPLQMT
jgi:hypothetical protein